MACTDEFDKKAYFGNLYELTIEKAAEKVFDGLWDQKQITKEEILNAMLTDIKAGKLKLVRGSSTIMGKYTSNPPILNAFKVAKWAEKNGLELESNGAWNSYILDEAELQNILEDKLNAIRAMQQSGKSLSAILSTSSIKTENEQDQYVTLLIENEHLKNQLNLQPSENTQAKENRKSMTSLFKLISAMAFDGYGYQWEDKKSPIPGELAKTVTRILGENIDEGTVRKWLRDSSEHYPPKK
jgi:hypothetical protein